MVFPKMPHSLIAKRLQTLCYGKMNFIWASIIEYYPKKRYFLVAPHPVFFPLRGNTKGAWNRGDRYELTINYYRLLKYYKLLIINVLDLIKNFLSVDI
jgi:hypothetical protein